MCKSILDMPNRRKRSRSSSVSSESSAVPEKASRTKPTRDAFYLRYYTGFTGKYGHEFLEFELRDGRLRYANNSNYDSMIRKEVFVTGLVVDEIRKLVKNSPLSTQPPGIDKFWPQPDLKNQGVQELEIAFDGQLSRTYRTCKFNSISEITKSRDAKNLEFFFHLIADLKSFVLMLINSHFRRRPI